MALLADIRTRARTDLDDTGSEVWTDTELDRHIDHALRELSHHIPRQRKTTLATVADTRALDISSLAPRRSIEAVEYPVDNDPKTWRAFNVWIDELTILSGSVPDGSNCNIYWTSQHTLDVSTTTLSEEEEEILVTGAEGYACRQQAHYLKNRVATGGPQTDRDYQADASRLLAEFHAALRSRKAVTTRRLYAPAEPKPTQDTDYGPQGA